MEISYWQSRWKKNNTGWHMQQVYPHLITFWHKLNLDKDSTVLVPLCGKSLDMHWLVDHGYRVIGVEVSEVAVREFIDESKKNFKTTTKGLFTVYTSNTLQLWQGDIFKLRHRYLPHIDAIYDKAALIAMPENKRNVYARHMQQLCAGHTQMLLNTLEYREEEMTGPPFSVSGEELEMLYGARFNIRLLHEASLLESVPKLQQRGLSSYLTEKIYHFLPNNGYLPEKNRLI